MEGISNQAGQEKNPYLTAGDKTYIIGTQDGNFPDLGGHTPGEMGGVWNHLIKLLDGFWVKKMVLLLPIPSKMYRIQSKRSFLILSQKQICCLYGHPGQSG